MRIRTEYASTIEMATASPENFLLIENHADGVTVRAALNNFSERRKLFLIRELAAEGYIPDCFQWYHGGESCGNLMVTWITDYSWMEIPTVVKARARRFMGRLFLYSGLLFLCALVLVLVGSR